MRPTSLAAAHAPPLDSALRVALVLCLVAALATCAVAAEPTRFPLRAVRFIVPAAPGSGADTGARILGPQLAASWRQPVVVESRPGAAGRAGVELAIKAAPDGHTVLVADDQTMAIHPVLFPSLPYDSKRDFVPLSLMMTAPLALVVHPSVGVESVKELIAYAKTHPGRLAHAAGSTSGRLALELFVSLSGVSVAGTVYDGTGPANASLLAGATQLGLTDLGGGAPLLRSGKLRVLAMASATRSRLYPAVPTFQEAGLPGMESRIWIAAFAPAGTPGPIAARLTEDIRRALAVPIVRRRLEALNFDVPATPSDELAMTLRADSEKWTKLARDRNLKFVE